MCPELEIGKGSVKPWIIPNIKYVTILFMLFSLLNDIFNFFYYALVTL